VEKSERRLRRRLSSSPAARLSLDRSFAPTLLGQRYPSCTFSLLYGPPAPDRRRQSLAPTTPPRHHPPPGDEARRAATTAWATAAPLRPCCTPAVPLLEHKAEHTERSAKLARWTPARTQLSMLRAPLASALALSLQACFRSPSSATVFSLSGTPPPPLSTVPCRADLPVPPSSFAARLRSRRYRRPQLALLKLTSP